MVQLTISRDRLKELPGVRSYADDIQEHLDDLILRLKFNPKAEEILKKANSIAILDAHGHLVRKKWKYKEAGLLWNRKRSVQEWVDEHEGKFDVLFLRCCNPGHITLKSEKSALIWASDMLTTEDIMSKSDSLNISDPLVA
jgi:hypothetical protein